MHCVHFLWSCSTGFATSQCDIVMGDIRWNVSCILLFSHPLTSHNAMWTPQQLIKSCKRFTMTRQGWNVLVWLLYRRCLDLGISGQDTFLKVCTNSYCLLLLRCFLQLAHSTVTASGQQLQEPRHIHTGARLTTVSGGSSGSWSLVPVWPIIAIKFIHVSKTVMNGFHSWLFYLLLW